VLSRIDDEFLGEVRRKGELFMDKLHRIDGVKDVSGVGLMIGVSLENSDAKQVVSACLKRGLLALTAKEKIRFLPPLIITDDEIERGLDIFAEALAETGR
jgi:acetylornithine/N-succinyldiaminopimelate aminotransferase